MRRTKGVGIGYELVEFAGPEGVEEASKPAHSGLVKPVVPVAALLAGGHEPGSFQQQQMLGDRGTAHGELAGQLGHGLFTVGEQLEQPAPGGLRCHLEEVDHANTLATANVFGNGWIGRESRRGGGGSALGQAVLREDLDDEVVVVALGQAGDADHADQRAAYPQREGAPVGGVGGRVEV